MRWIDPPRPDPSWAYFLDIDGTLIRIAKSPGEVRVTPAVRRLVETLFRSTSGAVALITGRPIADVDRLFPGVRLAIAGQHGAERRSASAAWYRHPVPSPRLAAVRTRVAEIVGRHPGLVLEDKGLSLALHYRGAPQLGGYAHRLLRSLATPLGAAYCIQAGKCVVEIRPTGKDKGTAIREFMQDPHFQGRTPIFLGDDATDEFGFAVVNRLGGHSVKVGAGPTIAQWRLPDVAGVRTWLQRGRPVPVPAQ